MAGRPKSRAKANGALAVQPSAAAFKRLEQAGIECGIQEIIRTTLGERGATAEHQPTGIESGTAQRAVGHLGPGRAGDCVLGFGDCGGEVAGSEQCLATYSEHSQILDQTSATDHQIVGHGWAPLYVAPITASRSRYFKLDVTRMSLLPRRPVSPVA